MKKILCVALSLTMALGLAACGADKPVNDTPTPNLGENPTYQEPVQSATPIGPAPTDEVVEPTAPIYKYETVGMQEINIGMDGKIHGFTESNDISNNSVVLDENGRLYYISFLSKGNPTDYNRTYTFDELRTTDNWNGGTMAIREEYKVHIEGSDKTSFYYNPDYEELRFETEGYMNSVSELRVLSKDNETGDLIFQRCLLDGTINEYKVKLRAVTPETRDGYVYNYEYMDETLDGKKFFFVSMDTLLVWGEDGQIQSYRREDSTNYQTAEEANYTQYYTLNHMNADDQINAITTLDNLLVFDSLSSIYTRQGDANNVYQVIDKYKKESLPIALPDGYTTDNIEKVHYHPNASIWLLIELSDGHVCYSTANNKSSLVLADGVSLQNMVGELQYIEGEFIALMDDFNIYKLMLH